MLTRRDLLTLLGAGATTALVVGAPTHATAHPAEQNGADAQATYAGLAHYQFAPDRVDDVIERWQTGLLAAARQAPGFVQGLLLTNLAAGRGIGIGLFVSKAAADAFGDTPAFRNAAARLAEVLTAPSVREEFDLRVG